MKIQFYKYQGTGNDFILLDNRTNRYDNLTAAQITFLCDRKFGIGADGLMLMNMAPDLDFEMVYYNADGNQSTMCGNGGRCMVQFAYDLQMHQYTYQFKAIDGLHLAEIDQNNSIKLKMKDVEEVTKHHGHYVLNTGSPHMVLFAHHVADIDVYETGKEIRNSKPFAAEGINVNFVETVDDDMIFVRTYERGVENETLSCGTGVVACALLNAHNEKGFNRVEVKTLGGMLSVEFYKISETTYNNIWLCGPAKFVFSGEIEVSA